MKKFTLSLILCISLIFSFTAFAENENITVKVNGEILETPISPKLINDRTMLPMRSIFERLGADVTWVEQDQIIFATKGDVLITMKIGVPKITSETTSDTKKTVIELETAPFIDGDYTLVPVRAVAESLNAKVDWIDETQTVVITTAK